MKFIKNTLLVFLILTAVGILLRGSIFRSLVTYKSIGEQANYKVIDDQLATYINTNTNDVDFSEIQEIIRTGLSITADQLTFTAENNHNDPNKLIVSKTAHCVGYAYFFATSCNYLLEKYNLSSDWLATPHKGQLYLLGVNVHKYFDSPFFKDHDFVIVENLRTGERYAVDPTVNDYLWIDLVTYVD